MFKKNKSRDFAVGINEKCSIRSSPITFKIAHPLFKQEVEITLKIHTLDVKGLLGRLLFKRMVMGDDNVVKASHNYKVIYLKRISSDKIKNIKNSIVIIDDNNQELYNNPYLEEAIIKSNNHYLLLCKKW